jgi:hypothetical protein
MQADCWLLASAFGMGTGVGLMTLNNAAQVCSSICNMTYHLLALLLGKAVLGVGPPAK